MNKRERKKFEKALANFAALAGEDFEALNKVAEDAELYSDEDLMYEGQAIVNFFTYRIKPILEGKKPGETESKFKIRKEEWEQRYHAWRIRTCDSCKNDFAYALNYEGVKYCSLVCLDRALNEIGLKVTRGRDITKRWGVQQHPAVVPAEAFQTLKTIYSDDAPNAFVQVQ